MRLDLSSCRCLWLFWTHSFFLKTFHGRLQAVGKTQVYKCDNDVEQLAGESFPATSTPPNLHLGIKLSDTVRLRAAGAISPHAAHLLSAKYAVLTLGSRRGDAPAWQRLESLPAEGTKGWDTVSLMYSSLAASDSAAAAEALSQWDR